MTKIMQDLFERNFVKFFQLFCYDAKPQNGGIVISRICCKYGTNCMYWDR